MLAETPSTIVLDHVADANGAELHRIAQLYPLPDFVKKASMAQLSQPQARTAFADPGRLLYPCNTAAATFLSAVFFAEKRADYEARYHPKNAKRVEQQLAHFVNYWGIKAAVDAALQQRKDLLKNSDDLPDGDFAYVWAGDNGVKQRHLRLKNASEVKAAAQWLLQYRDTLPFADRNVVAGKIREKAAYYGAALGAELDEFVEKQAGAGICSPKEVTAMIRQRALLAKGDFKEQITKLADMIESKPRYALGPDILVKLAGTVDDIDRKLGLAGKYTDTIRRPEDVIFGVTYKEAQAAVSGACALTTGSIYDSNEFTKLSLDDLEGLLGSAFAREVSDGLNVDPVKLAEVAQTMPRGDAELFDQLCSQARIRPIHMKAAAQRHGLRPEAAKMLAAAY